MIQVHGKLPWSFVAKAVETVVNTQVIDAASPPSDLGSPAEYREFVYSGLEAIATALRDFQDEQRLGKVIRTIMLSLDGLYLGESSPIFKPDRVKRRERNSYSLHRSRLLFMLARTELSRKKISKKKLNARCKMAARHDVEVMRKWEQAARKFLGKHPRALRMVLEEHSAAVKDGPSKKALKVLLNEKGEESWRVLNAPRNGS